MMKSAWFSNSWVAILTGTGSSWTWRSRRKGSSSVSWLGIELLLSVIFSPIAGSYCLIRLNCSFMAFFTRYIMQGMVKSSTNDVYWEVMRLRRTMACARLGFESWNSTPQVAILIHQVQNLRLIEPLYTRFTQNSMSIDTLYPVIYRLIKYMMASCRSIKNYSL